MSTATWLRGDVFTVLASDSIPDGSIDLVCTSPPFWKQRAYLPNDHPLKPFEIGQEPSPAEFIDVMLRLVAAIRPKLSKYGSIAIELADTYAGSGGSGGDYGEGGMREGQPTWTGSAAALNVPGGKTGQGARSSITSPRADGILAKSLCMIPEAFRVGLAYGINPLTGAESPAGRWICRNVVDWCRLNPTPGDDGDKFRRASSDILVATLSPKRWWDGDAVRVPASTKTNARTAKGVDVRPNTTAKADQGGNTNRDTLAIQHLGDGTRPLYDWWEMSSDPYPGAHFAVWPPAVASRLVLSMCPIQVCTTCGEPSRRITKTLNAVGAAVGSKHWIEDTAGFQRDMPDRNDAAPDFAIRETIGWTDCGHNTWRPGRVLDPFGGSGTTGSVATGSGRDALLIDLDERNVALARDRIGMFLVEGE